MRPGNFYIEKAAQCRRLAREANDDHAREALIALAEEFELRALEIAATESGSQQSGL
jgi:hypothetical protein